MNTENEKSIQEQADWTVTEYTHTLLEKGQEKVIKLRNGNKDICNCANCMKYAVADMNSALDFFLGEGEEMDRVYEEWHWSIEPTERGLEIVQGTTTSIIVYDADTDTGLAES